MATKPEKSKKTDNAEANRIKRLQRTLKKQPNNEQVKTALKTTRIHRKTPVNPVWTASWRRIAQLMKKMSGHFDPNCMSSNELTARNAWSKPSKNLNYKVKADHQRPFSFAARAHNQYGVVVWN